MIERIEVLRGPAAARYGNGAAAWLTSLPKGSGEWHGSWDAYFNAPEHKEEGATKRTNFSLTGPLGDEFSFRLYGNLDKTRLTRGISTGHQSARAGTYATTLPAGREGVINKDINGVVRWDFAPLQSLELEAGYSPGVTCMRVIRRTPTLTLTLARNMAMKPTACIARTTR